MKTISLLHWNIWDKQPMDPVIAEIKRWNPDIVCIQECIVSTEYASAELIAEALNYSFVYQSCQKFTHRPKKSEQGNAILTRFPILTKHSAVLQQERQKPTDGSDEGRMYLELEIQVGTTTLTVATTHLSYSPKFIYSPKRAKEAEKLVKIVAQKQKNYIFTGDLNTPPNSPITSKIEQYLNNAGPAYDQPTWTTKPFNYHGWFEDQLRWRIDYVFASPDIKVESAQILATSVSDHLPILLKVKSRT